jgi:DNA-binding winged helix-turn-helix (wHTH) protein/TolB-like protein
MSHLEIGGDRRISRHLSEVPIHLRNLFAVSCLCDNLVRMTDSRRFRFGLFEFDLSTKELRREGVLVRLQSQPAQVLACLILHAGQAVSREELRRAVWSAETFVDFDRGLNFCIGQVRLALDDDSTTPRYIRTLPKRGYQFIAPVEQVESIGDVNASDGSTLGRTEVPSTKKNRFRSTAVLVCASIVLLMGIVIAAYWVRSRQSTNRHPIIAVLRFDNQTSDPRMIHFGDALTDNVVEELTKLSLGRYDVIGSAHILGLPRDQRDLTAIGSSLHAGYVVLGQLQTDGAEVRILVHLIRLPSQTHLWVTRLDRTTTDFDPLSIESEAAQKVGAEFSERIVKDSSGNPLPEIPNR